MGNYAPVQVEIWNHPKFQRLATHPLGDLRLAALYVLTTPYRNYLTGFYRIKLADITDHLACTDSHARAVIEALTAESWIRYDYENKVLLVLDHLEHNPMGGSKQLTSAVDHVKTLRHSPLLGEFVEASRRYAHKCPGLYDALIGAFGPQPEPAPPPADPAPATARPERDTAPPSPRTAQTALAEMMDYLKQHLPHFISKTNTELLAAMAGETGWDVVRRAAEVTVGENKRQWSYFQGVWRRYRDERCLSYADALATDQRRHDARASPRQQGNGGRGLAGLADELERVRGGTTP